MVTDWFSMQQAQLKKLQKMHAKSLKMREALAALENELAREEQALIELNGRCVEARLAARKGSF